MYYYRTKIQYEGTKYAGFQWQNGIKTVQSEFNNAISQIVDGKFTTMAASRTDTGVHAMEQVVKISSTNPIELGPFIEEINKKLPADIKCFEIVNCEGLFRPAAEAETKEYRYFFTNKTQVSKEDSLFIANISNQLKIDEMVICINALRGQHDFCNFYSSGSNVKSTIREISFCELSLINPQEILSKQELFKIPPDLNNCYQLKIIANGFLKQMIRHIVSALWMVGSGKLTTNDFLRLLDGHKAEKQMWKVAAPNGLFLYKINYP